MDLFFTLLFLSFSGMDQIVESGAFQQQEHHGHDYDGGAGILVADGAPVRNKGRKMAEISDLKRYADDLQLKHFLHIRTEI